jgi:hypothetical protein
MSHSTVPEDTAASDAPGAPLPTVGADAGTSTTSTSEPMAAPSEQGPPVLPGPIAVAAAKAGLIAYGVAWAYAFIAIVVARLSDGINEGLDGTSRFATAFQAVGLAFLAPLKLSLEQFGVDGGLSVMVVPVSVTVVAVAALVWLSARAQRGTTTTVQHTLLAGLVTGAVFAVVTTLLGWIFALRLQADVLEETFDLDVGGDASVASFVGFLTVVTVASFVAASARAWVAYSRLNVRVSAATDQVRTLGIQFVAFSVIASLIGAFMLVVDEGFDKVPTLLALTLLLWGNVLVYVVTLGHFGALEYSMTGAGSIVGIGGSESETDAFHVFVDGWSWALLLPLLAVLTALLTSCVAYARQPRRANTNDRFTYAAVVFGLAGIVLTLAGRVAISAKARGSEGDGWAETLQGSLEVVAGPAVWMFMLLAVWGVAIEASRRYVAPTLAPMLPRPILKFALLGVRASEEELAMTPPSAASRKRARLAVLVLGGALLLAALVAGVRWAGNTYLFAPSAPVEKAMTAIQQGDFDTLEKLVDKSEVGDTSLLSEEVYEAARYDDLDFEIVEKEGWDNDHVSILVKAKAADKEWRQFYEVERVGRTFGLFNDWELTSFSLPHINVDTSAATTVMVNGVEVDPSGDSLAVLPGKYTFSAPADNEYFEFNELSYEVTSGNRASNSYKSLKEKPTSELLAAASAQARELLDECAASTSLELPHDACPDVDFGWGEFRNIEYTVDSYPSLRAVPSDGGWSIETRTPGQFWGSAIDEYGDEVTTLDWYDEPDEVYLGGDITVGGDGTLTIDWYEDDYYGW